MTRTFEIPFHGMVLLMISSLSSRSVCSFVAGRTSVVRVSNTASGFRKSSPSEERVRLETMDAWNQKCQHFSHSNQSPESTVDDFPRRIKRSRRTNRPGFNSYLKVILDDATMNLLHQMSLTVQDQIEQLTVNPIQTNVESQEEKIEQVSDPPVQSLPTKSDSKPLAYRPRGKDSLHMTLFFGGETICALPQQELQDWHTRISQRLEQSGFFLKGRIDERGSVDKTVNDFGFRISGLKVFPPRRNNLVVAILEPNDEWHNLYSDLREIAKDDSCSPELANIVAYSPETWIAHVTLGNLIGGMKCDRKGLDSLLLESVFDSTLATLSMKGTTFEATTVGIGMGGPVPEQVELSWDYHFSGRSNAETGNQVLSS